VCGIVGNWPISPDQATLERALTALAHRGADDRGKYFDAASGVGLAHARLAIIELSFAGHQPMASADDEVALAFNGEIYNYRELLVELESSGAISFAVAINRKPAHFASKP